MSDLNRDFDALVGRLTDDQLAELRSRADAAAEARNPAPGIEAIRPGMSDEAKRRVKERIASVLKQR